MPHILKINFNLSISVLPDDRIPDSFVHKMKHFLKKKMQHITCSPTKSVFLKMCAAAHQCAMRDCKYLKLHGVTLIRRSLPFTTFLYHSFIRFSIPSANTRSLKSLYISLKIFKKFIYYMKYVLNDRIRFYYTNIRIQT